MRTTTITLAALATLSLAACEQKGASTPATTSTTPTGPAWVLTSEPADALSITAAKADAAEGDQIIIRGIIGGTKAPITAESPVFRIIDAGLFNKCTSEDDHCTTPWDYCCAAPDVITSNSATVQLVNADGSPFTGDPTADLNPLDEVILVGNVGPRPNNDVLTIKATGVFRVE